MKLTIQAQDARDAVYLNPFDCQMAHALYRMDMEHGLVLHCHVKIEGQYYRWPVEAERELRAAHHDQSLLPLIMELQPCTPREAIEAENDWYDYERLTREAIADRLELAGH